MNSVYSNFKTANMKNLLIITLTLLILSGCKEHKKTLPDYLNDSAEKLVDIDNINIIEKVIADSTYMEAKGDTAWKQISDKLIRIKMGQNCYLRQETNDNIITSYTYRYE